MQTVEPIRNIDQIEAMKSYLKKRNIRDWLLFVLGINSALRISDLLMLEVEDVKNADRITLREIKTNKEKDFPLSTKAREAVAEYLSATNLKDSDPLFISRKVTAKGLKPKAISRQQAWEILNQAARHVGITDAIGTHTMRKTFGYHAYQQGYDIAQIQQLLNHSTPAVTLRYIGITKDDIDSIYMTVDL